MPKGVGHSYGVEFRHRLTPYCDAIGTLLDEGVGSRTQALGLLTMSANYWRSRTWSTRVYLDRTLTVNGRDTDVVMLGLGYAF
ncbi:MAG TPA: hypothetical protein VN869_05070, partial [Steroidobacteraceae bacterium]|nr:hypothetical protein [Steroidobacteraceae bacterium]